LFVAPLETILLNVLSNPGQFGGEVTEGVGRVNILDDQIETVEGSKRTLARQRILMPVLRAPPGGSLELGSDRLRISSRMNCVQV
jgi:hypothetical protein